MLNTVINTGKKVAHLVVSHGAFIDNMALFFSTIENTDLQFFINDYSKNELNVADSAKYFNLEKFPDEAWCKYCSISTGYFTISNEDYSFEV